MEPTASVEVLKVATPADRVPLPMVVVPSRKLTVPVGEVVPEAGVTVTVKVMLVPLTAEVLDAARVVVVAMTGAVTVTTTAEEVLPVKLLSPE